MELERAMTGNREALAAFLLDIRSKGITEHRLLSAFEAIPRRNFVPVIHLSEAYAPGQMPVECGQTMTSIEMVARVLSVLDVQPGNRVLELGTGTGYQTALISTLAEKVLSVERFRTLREKAETRLSQLGIGNTIVKLMDGSVASSELGIHDRIISNCSFEELPRDFLDNLSAGGVMIAPIGPADGKQKMCRFTKVGLRFQFEELFTARMQPFIAGVSKAI